MRVPKKSLVYDVSNLLFRVASTQKYNPHVRDASPDELVGLCMHVSLQSIYKYYEKHKPDFVVFAFEGGLNWRKNFTADARSRRQYKGNRVIDPEMAHYYKLIDSFRETMSTHTSICCLCVETLEADDVIAGYCQLYSSSEHEIVIVSGDRDFTQLLRLPGVKLINPDNGKPRNTPDDKEYEPDLDYWIFKKCVRGDGGDNVPAAYPRVRETRIKKAYENEYDRANFMNEVWIETIIDEAEVTGTRQVTHRVGALFEENVKLLDLFKQPADVRLLIEAGVKLQVETVGNYSHFHFLRFLQQYDLQRVSEEAVKFVNLFANNQRFLKGEKPPAVSAPVKLQPLSRLLDF